MPWSRMYRPVRRCQKNELSDSRSMPTPQPNSAKTALNSVVSPGGCHRRRGDVADGAAPGSWAARFGSFARPPRSEYGH